MSDIKHKHELSTADINIDVELPSLEKVMTEVGRETCCSSLIKEMKEPYSPLENVSFNFKHYK